MINFSIHIKLDDLLREFNARLDAIHDEAIARLDWMARSTGQRTRVKKKKTLVVSGKMFRPDEPYVRWKAAISKRRSVLEDTNPPKDWIPGQVALQKLRESQL